MERVNLFSSWQIVHVYRLFLCICTLIEVVLSVLYNTRVQITMAEEVAIEPKPLMGVRGGGRGGAPGHPGMKRGQFGFSFCYILYLVLLRYVENILNPVKCTLWRVITYLLGPTVPVRYFKCSTLLKFFLNHKFDRIIWVFVLLNWVYHVFLSLKINLLDL